MSVFWKKGSNPEQLISKIENSRQLNDNGKVTFKSFDYHINTSLLYNMLEFPSDLPEEEARKIVNQAAFDTGSEGAITTKRILTEVNKLQNKYNNLPIQRFVLLTSLSINNFNDFRRIQSDGNLVLFDSFNSKQSRKFKKKANSLLQSGKKSLFVEPPENYSSIRIYVSAKSNHDAVNKALDYIDFIRGIWNWVLNRRHGIRMSWGNKPKPINKIILGPLHTLHHTSGKLAIEDTWWYEPNYLGEISTLNPSKSDIELLYNNFYGVRKKLSSCGYSNVIQDATIRYTRALDERDWNTAYLKLWSVPELLTDTGRSNYELTVKRAAFLFEERDYYFQLIQQLKEYRNKYVHLNQKNTEMETYLYQLKNVVEVLFTFHIGNNFHFSSIQDAASFLSLPHNEKPLNAKLKRLNSAKKFRGFT